MNTTVEAAPKDTATAPRDEDLVAGLVRRDEAAVALLLERWWSRAYRLAHQLTGDAAAAEDVAQEAFVQALRAAGSYDPARGAFAPWFLRIVRNAAFNTTRARKRRVDHEVTAARDRPEAETDDVATRADAAGVRAHLHALSPPYREALALHYLQGLTFQEVAEVLGCPLGTVASRMRRGLEALRARVTPAGSALAATPSLTPGADPLLEALAQAWSSVAPAAAPSAARLLDGAAAPLPPVEPAPAAPTTPPTAPASRWARRAPSLLVLAGVFAAGTATLALLLHDPLTPPLPPRVVQTSPPRPQPPRVATTPPVPARPTGIVVPAPTGAATAPDGAVVPAPVAEERPQAIDAVAYDSTGQRALAGRRDGHVELWDLKQSDRLHRLAGHGARVTAVTFTPDGVLALSASYDGSARMWDVASGEVVHVLQHASGAKRRVLALAVSPDGQLAATAGEDGLVHLWSVVSGERVTTLQAHSRPARAVAFSADGGQLLTAGEDHRVALWSRRGEVQALLETDAGYSHAILDGRDVALVAGGPRSIERLDLVRRERVGTFDGDGPLAITAPTVPARDRGLLVRADADAFRFVDPETGAEKVRFEDPNDLLLAITLSPDGRYALTGAESGRLKVWDLRPPTPNTPVVLLGPRDSTVNTGDPRGERVVVAGAGATALRAADTAALPTATAVDLRALRRELAGATRSRARQIVAGLDPRDLDQLKVLLEVLGGDFDWTVRQLAVRTIAKQVGDPRVQGALFAVLDQPRPSPAVQEGIALALGSTRSPVFVPRLVQLLASEPWVVRRAAAIALSWTPDARAVEPLIAALLSEREARVSSLLTAALESTTHAYCSSPQAWKEWWKDARRDFVVGDTRQDRPFGGLTETLELEEGRSTERWTVRIRGLGPPLIVLPDLGHGPGYLETTLRWLEASHTVVYVGMPEPADGERVNASTTARRLARLVSLLREREQITDEPELVLGHGLSALVVSLYPEEPGTRAKALVLVSPIASLPAWTAALARAERDAGERGDTERMTAFHLLMRDGANAPNVDARRRAELRLELFTSNFADERDLLIGSLIGEWTREQRLPTYPSKIDGWHDTPTLVVYDKDELWTTADEARALAAQSTRSRTISIANTARMPFYEQREQFERALRWFR